MKFIKTHSIMYLFLEIYAIMCMKRADENEGRTSIPNFHMTY